MSNQLLSIDILNNLIYNFYPINSGIPYSVEYENSSEFQFLRKTCHFFDDRREFWDAFIREIRNEFGYSIVKDRTMLSWMDRCYSLDIIIENSLDSICVINLNISILFPYYSMFHLESNKTQIGNRLPSVSFEVEKFDKAKFKKLKKILDKSGFLEFPQGLLHQIIPDITYKSIPLGKFTYFNAFFLDEIPNRI